MTIIKTFLIVFNVILIITRYSWQAYLFGFLLNGLIIMSFVFDIYTTFHFSPYGELHTICKCFLNWMHWISPSYVPKRPTYVQNRYGTHLFPYDLARINQFTGKPLGLSVPSFLGQSD